MNMMINKLLTDYIVYADYPSYDDDDYRFSITVLVSFAGADFLITGATCNLRTDYSECDINTCNTHALVALTRSLGLDDENDGDLRYVLDCIHSTCREDYHLVTFPNNEKTQHFIYVPPPGSYPNPPPSTVDNGYPFTKDMLNVSERWVA